MQVTADVDCIDPIWLSSELKCHHLPTTGTCGLSFGSDALDEELTDQEEDKELQDYSDDPVHADGIPCCDVKLLARKHRTREFSETVFEMLRDRLGLVGWANLPEHMKTSISIYKVGGSLTNAVFFVSCAVSSALITQSPHHESTDPPRLPPTVLLRIYGPSSGTLISRKHELHMLHTLSAEYGIGPLLLGTFFNGRVEQFFESRPLTKHEIRDPKISQWIARKMRELHSVDLSAMMNITGDTSLNRRFSQSLTQNGQIISDPRWSLHSPSRSAQNTGNSWSTNFTSESDASAHTIYTENPHVASPGLYGLTSPLSAISSPDIHPFGITHTRENLKIGSIDGLKFSSRIKVGAWENITRWQHEATKVLTEVSKLTLGFHELDLNPAVPDEQATSEDQLDLFRSSPGPLTSATALVNYFKRVDLPRLIIEMKLYKAWVHAHEKREGKSPRVFSHNDTQ